MDGTRVKNWAIYASEMSCNARTVPIGSMPPVPLMLDPQLELYHSNSPFRSVAGTGFAVPGATRATSLAPLATARARRRPAPIERASVASGIVESRRCLREARTLNISRQSYLVDLERWI